MPLDAQVRQLGAACIDQALALLEDPRESTVHDARKRMKEARAILTLFRSALAPDTRRQCMAMLREAGHHLARAREAAARLRCFDDLLAGADLAVDRSELTTLRSHLVDAHLQAVSDAVHGGDVEGARRRLENARQAFDTLTLTRQGWSALAPGLRRQYARARRTLRDAASTPTAETFHAWRQQTKRHQFHLELLASLAAGGLRNRRRRLRELGEILGDDHDLAELLEHLQAHFAATQPRGVSIVSDIAAARSDELRREAVARGLEVFRPGPRVWARRVRGRLTSRLPAVRPGLSKAKPKGADVAGTKAARGGDAVRTLLLLRHAKSSWDDATLDDHARPLNPRGRRDAPRMGRLLAEEGLLPSFLLTSTAMRAVSTARAVAEASGFQGTVRELPGIYGVSAPMLLALLQYEGGNHRCVMLVGHNPSLEELLEGLCGEHHRLPTAALARVDLPIATWADLALDGSATGVRVWRPKEL